MSSEKNALLQQLEDAMPLKYEDFEFADGNPVGLVVVDEVKGFCTVGMGSMAPSAPNAQISRMVEETDRLCREFSARGWPILAFLDTHEVHKPEVPYPPHCIRGTGEEKLVPELEWLEGEACATLMPKDCINGFVGAMQPDGSNLVLDWLTRHGVQQVLTVGICTDVCVLDFVTTALSARNHGVFGRVTDVLVYANACATYDLPRNVAESLGFGSHAAHPQEVTHHMGLYFMYSRGARLVRKVTFPASS
eukprot:jgi/Mesen1/1339/ME000013S00833